MGVDPTAIQFAGRKELTRIIRFAIGFDLRLEPTRMRHRLWEAFSRFPDEKAARAYIEQALWTNGPVCPRCRSGEHIGSGNNPYRCNACDRQFNVRIGTIFEGSHIPLRHWLWAIMILASARRKVSSAKLAALLNSQAADSFKISQPAACGMIRTLRPAWREITDSSNLLKNDHLDFADFTRRGWPFFSERSRLKLEHCGLESPDDAYPLGSDDMVFQRQSAESEAAWKAKRKIWKAENWEMRKKRGGRRIKGLLRHFERLKARTEAHRADHRSQISMKWMSTRECPICRFGESEWLRWKRVSAHLDLISHEEFWNWIEDLKQQTKLPYEDPVVKRTRSMPKCLQECFEEPLNCPGFIAKWKTKSDRVKERFIRAAQSFQLQSEQLQARLDEERQRMQEEERLRTMLDVLI